MVFYLCNLTSNPSNPIENPCYPIRDRSSPQDHPIPMRRWAQNLRFLTAVQLLPALESGEETTLVGGQAVLEGVMMRSPHAWGIAIRKPSGEIATHSEPL